MPSIFGDITKPTSHKYEGLTDFDLGPTAFLNAVINLIIVLAGIFTILNFVLAGYGYLSAGGNPQKITDAGNKILQSLVGLIIVAASFIIAAIIGKVLFNNPTALLSIIIYKFE